MIDKLFRHIFEGLTHSYGTAPCELSITASAAAIPLCFVLHDERVPACEDGSLAVTARSQRVAGIRRMHSRPARCRAG